MDEKINQKLNECLNEYSNTQNMDNGEQALLSRLPLTKEKINKKMTLNVYSFFYRALLQKTPIILRSLLIVATPCPSYSLLHLECHSIGIFNLNLHGLCSTNRGKRDLENYNIECDLRLKK